MHLFYTKVLEIVVLGSNTAKLAYFALFLTV